MKEHNAVIKPAVNSYWKPKMLSYRAEESLFSKKKRINFGDSKKNCIFATRKLTH